MPHKESPDEVCGLATIADEIDAIREIYRSAPRCNGERHIVHVDPRGSTYLDRWRLFGSPL